MSAQITPVAVPIELVFDNASSMLDSRKIEQRIQPYSQSTFTYAGQAAKFTIPQTDRTLLSGQTMYYTGKLTLKKLIQGKTYGILGSFYSLYQRQTVNANGTFLETFDRVGEAANMLIAMTMNGAEKIAQGNSIGCGYITDDNSISNIGLILGSGSGLPFVDSTETIQTVTFAIPVIGVLDAAKYIPMWNSNIEIELTINDIKNWLVGKTGDAKAGDVTFEISELELVFDSIELSPESFSMVMANYPQKILIKTQTYSYGSGSAPVAGSGALDVAINQRLTSMKQLFFYFTSDSLSDKTYGGINPNLQDVVFITNGKYYPQRPIKCTNPSECYMQIQKAFGSIKSYSHSGSIGKSEFCRRADANGLYNKQVLVGNDVNGPSSPTLFEKDGSNKFYLAIDTEIINTNKNSLYNGISTGVNSTIRVNIADNLGTKQYTCYYWCCYDVLLEFDFLTGITSAKY